MRRWPRVAVLVEPPLTALKPNRIPVQKTPRHGIVHPGSIVVEAHSRIPFSPCISHPVAFSGCRKRRAAAVEEHWLAISGVSIPFNNRTRAIRQCGDAVLLVAVVVSISSTAGAEDDFVDVAAIDIVVHRAACGGAGGVVGDSLLADLKIDHVVRAVVAAHAATERVPAVEDVVGSVVVRIRSLEPIAKIPG